MATVEQLTERVKLLAGTPAAEHTGVSDHLMHVQEAELALETGVYKVVLATFNVLAQKYVWYQNGKKPDGSPTPSWFKLEDQQGLENTPLADETLAKQRNDTVVSMIVQFFVQHARAILCLQECDFSIIEEVEKSVPSIHVQFDAGGSPGKVTLSHGVGASALPSSDNLVMCSLVDIGVKIVIVNGHLGFKTASNHASFRALKERYATDFVFVLGDYNIQCMPISETTKNEGSTQTLSEFINNVVCLELGWKYALAIHELGYTNFNCRKNCADPKNNADHFDNILFLHPGGCDVKFTPITAPYAGTWWN